MKCILLCCFLIFCVLQTTSADRVTDQQIWNLQFQAMQQINDITNPILAKIQSDVDAAKVEGKNGQPCYERARILMKSFVDPGFADLRKCRTDAQVMNSVPYAVNCNNRVVSVFRINAQTVQPVATSCLASL